MKAKLVTKGYCKFKHKQVTYTYKVVLNNGSSLYFDLSCSDFGELENIKENLFLSCFVSVNDYTRSESITDFVIFKTLLNLG